MTQDFDDVSILYKRFCLNTEERPDDVIITSQNHIFSKFCPRNKVTAFLIKIVVCIRYEMNIFASSYEIPDHVTCKSRYTFCIQCLVPKRHCLEF